MVETFFLGAVHRHIRVLDQRHRILSVLRANADTDAAFDMKVVPLN